MSEDSFYVERGETEVGTLATTPDDKCNHLNCILHDMRARANLRKPYTTRPRPQYTGAPGDALRDYPKTCDIGKLRKYSHTIMRGIYQLARNGVIIQDIAALTGIPLNDVHRIMEHKTEIAGREFNKVRLQPTNPSTGEIIRRLSKEAANVYAANRKIV